MYHTGHSGKNCKPLITVSHLLSGSLNINKIKIKNAEATLAVSLSILDSLFDLVSRPFLMGAGVIVILMRWNCSLCSPNQVTFCAYTVE